MCSTFSYTCLPGIIALSSRKYCTMLCVNFVLNGLSAWKSFFLELTKTVSLPFPQANHRTPGLDCQSCKRSLVYCLCLILLRISSGLALESFLLFFFICRPQLV